MRILMVTTNASLMDGINRHILTVASAINQREGFEVAVCTAMPAGELNEALRQNGVNTYALGYANGHKLGIISAYRKVLRDFRPDIIHSHVMALMERIVSATGFKHIRYVDTIHGIVDPKSKPSLRDRIERILTRRFAIKYAAHCYISNGVKQALCANGSSVPAIVSYNPLRFGDIAPKSRRLQQLIGVDAATPTIGTACRIAEVKNPTAFTTVMCEALRLLPSAHAVVMGDGDAALVESCMRIVDQAKVADRFHWLGYCADAPQLVNDLDCFVMTSHREGMPTSVLESMATKTPIAMFRGDGGLIDIEQLNSAEGPIVAIADKDDFSGLASAIAKLINNPEQAEKQAENAFAVGRKHFDIDSVASQLCSLYTQLL